MAEIGPEHPLTYREEITRPFFDQLKSAGSMAVVGSSSMGKSRLLHFIFRDDVIAHFLPEKQERLLFIWVDNHRLVNLSEWAFYELMLTALAEEASVRKNLPQSLKDQLNSLRNDLIHSESPLLGRRNVELASKLLCETHGLSLCFLFDEFDAIYKALPGSVLMNLRALRDRFKYQISFVLIVRDRPDRLRDPRDHEGFYELFSRNMLGLRPYQPNDAKRVIKQLEVRKSFQISEKYQNLLLSLSGGHPGLIVALVGLIKKHPNQDWVKGLNWLSNKPSIIEECTKIWLGLAEDERRILTEVAHDVKNLEDSALEVLLLKGLLNEEDSKYVLFSPLLKLFIKQQHPSTGLGQLEIDSSRGIVKVGRNETPSLTHLEFKFLSFLADYESEICKRDDILSHLYPEEAHVPSGNDNRIDSLVRHIRKKIEPNSTPRYLLTVRGLGYRLIKNPDEANF